MELSLASSRTISKTFVGVSDAIHSLRIILFTWDFRPQRPEFHITYQRGIAPDTMWLVFFTLASVFLWWVCDHVALTQPLTSSATSSAHCNNNKQLPATGAATSLNIHT